LCFLWCDTNEKYRICIIAFNMKARLTFLSGCLCRTVSSNLMQSDGANEEFADRQCLAMGARKICQQAIPHAGFYITHCRCTRSFQVNFFHCAHRTDFLTTYLCHTTDVLTLVTTGSSVKRRCQTPLQSCLFVIVIFHSSQISPKASKKTITTKHIVKQQYTVIRFAKYAVVFLAESNEILMLYRVV